MSSWRACPAGPLDHAAVVGPAAVHALRCDDSKGPENHLFSTAHQISECRLHMADHCLEAGTLCAAEGEWSRGAGQTMAARVADCFRCVKDRDVEGWVALFAAKAGRQYDLPETWPFIGRKHLTVFLEPMFTAFTDMSPTILSVNFGENVAAAH